MIIINNNPILGTSIYIDKWTLDHPLVLIDFIIMRTIAVTNRAFKRLLRLASSYG